MTLTPEDNAAFDFDHCESLYWVFTHRCNDVCSHCYNSSGPEGGTMTEAECLSIVRNLPERCDRIILSGGEPLAERAKLYLILEALEDRYGSTTQLMLQTNGDLLTPKRLDEILKRGVVRIDVASIDRYHILKGSRRSELETMFTQAGLVGDDPDPLIEKSTYLKPGTPSYGFWGATDDIWLGGNWARGRAMETGVWMKDGSHNFCSILSGARGFLGGTELPQEVSIQLWAINPCCPGTRDPLGDARVDRVADVLSRMATSPIMQALNAGNPYAMGASIGVSEEEGRTRAIELGNVCLWCDEFLRDHYDVENLSTRHDNKTSGGRTLPIHQNPEIKNTL